LGIILVMDNEEIDYYEYLDNKWLIMANRVANRGGWRFIAGETFAAPLTVFMHYDYE
jgi:hypothetical protein